MKWASRDDRLPGRRARWLTSTVVAALVLSVLPALGPAPVALAGTEGATEAQRALEDAKETGNRVEVVGERSEQTTVYANPDGFSFTLEESAVPVRVANPGGGWQVPDPTLEMRSDGMIAPRAAAVEMEFSGGGTSSPLVKIAEQGRSLELGWPGKLPLPELDGASALYKDVIDGVDLRLIASTEGFRQLLVVKTPEAAASAELKQIDYSLKSDGLKITKGKAGNLTAVDADGNSVFRAPPAQMWDSAGEAQSAQSSPDPQNEISLTASKAALTDSKASGDAEGGTGSGDGLEPGQGDRVARMNVQLGDDTLTVVPDAEMLTSTEAAHLPLYIDPTVTWDESERTLLRSDGYESYGWSNGDDNLGKGAGKCGTWNGYYCGPGYTQRLYFEFSPEKLKGKRVLKATFRVTEPWAFQCDPRWVDLVRTNNISSTTTWTSRPAELDWMVDRNVSAGRGSLCDPDSPDAPIEFSDNPEETNENLTPTVESFAAGAFSRLTLELRAHDESDASAWKRFRNDAVLAVDFVGLPDKPTGVGLVSGSGTVCEKVESDPAVVDSPTPTLKAYAQTKAGGEQEAQLRVYFDLDQKNADGTWTDTTAGNGSVRPSTSYVADGESATLLWSSLAEGTLYRYQAWTYAYYNGGASYLSSATSGWCYFKVDTTAPHAPRITARGPYSECTANDCAPGGGPGVKGTFIFAPADGDENVTDFQFRTTQATSWVSVCKSVAPCLFMASIVPANAGTYRLYTRAVDSLGRPGTQGFIDFQVAAGPGPVGLWHFDEEDDGAAIDSATASGSVRHHATLGSGAVRDDHGRRGLITHDEQGAPLASPKTDKGLRLDGASTDFAATAGPVVQTASSYTVSAWALLEDGSKDSNVLAQNGTYFSSFYLGYRAASRTWELRTSPKDTADGDISHQIIKAKQLAAIGVWTHLAAVYKAEDKQIKLYVNGELQGTYTVASSWLSTGPLQIGRAWQQGAYRDYWKGSIDEVTAWQTALIDSQILDEARLTLPGGFKAAELVAAWSADAAVGTTVADTTSGYGRTLKLTGGVSSVGDELVLDGVDDAATVEGPLVDDLGSFTVSTLVALPKDGILSKPAGYIGQVLGQRTASGSAWGIWYELVEMKTEEDPETDTTVTKPIGFWHFGRLEADGTFSSVRSDEVATLDTPVRLTGAFDAQAGDISMTLSGTPKAFTAERGAGEFAIGKGLDGGEWKHFLPARITDVRVWSGAMRNSTQIETVVGS
ncbi:LamG domain-containing protein [Streptomyces sp. NPDC056944]|uniref:LamG domain-containing protein n=1 Tax=Streptomyces sp. NPDC056944 TaxID=3345972 RepID=UPI0036426C82